MDYFIIAPNNDPESRTAGEGGRHILKAQRYNLRKKNKGSLKVKIRRMSHSRDGAMPRKTSEEPDITGRAECKGIEDGPMPVTELTNVSCDCRRKCENLVEEEERQIVFCYFSKLADTHKQNLFIRRSIKCCSVNRGKSQSVGLPSTNNNGHKYYLKTSRGDILVCKTFFANTLDVSKTRIDQVLTELEPGKASDTNEKRKTDLEENRSRRLKGCMSKKHKLNWKKMFRLYLEKCREKNLSPVNVTTFLYLFVNC